jgi:Flp pilus assembly protein TadG
LGFDRCHDGWFGYGDLVNCRRPTQQCAESSDQQRLRSVIGRLRSDRGSAVVEFTLVAPLALIVMLAVLQLALAMHVRSTIITAAAEGARIAAMMDADLAAGEERTREILANNMAGAAVTDVRAQRSNHQGLSIITVDVTADLPLIGFFGPTKMEFTGSALDERWTTP